MIEIRNMQCDHMTNPLAVDDVRPLLCFAFYGEQADAKVERCKVMVSADTEKLEKNIGDCWDSGWMDSGDLLNLRYAVPLWKAERLITGRPRRL